MYDKCKGFSEFSSSQKELKLDFEQMYNILHITLICDEEIKSSSENSIFLCVFGGIFEEKEQF